MKHTDLTLLILTLNSMIDSGRYDDISPDEVGRHINDGSILRFLSDRGGRDVDLSFLETSYRGPFTDAYINHLQAIYDVSGDGRRKWGVRNKGLCLLLAWTNEILQQGSGWKADENIAFRA